MKQFITASPALYPWRLQPVYKDYVWGGDRIPRQFQREAPPGIYAESWEIADHPDGESLILNGPLAGKTLGQALRLHAAAVLGPHRASDAFPLLIKLIDARERLSLQVHPNDETARLHGGEAKTEMWYFLAADPCARVLAGLKPGVGRPQFEAALASGRVEEVLVSVPVAAGEAVYVPGGRLHAIDAGCLILEIQQNSNTTYRVHDWGRMGADGKPRPMHLEQALKVIRWDDAGAPKAPPRILEPIGFNEHAEILSSPYFRLERFVLAEALSLSTEHQRFHALFVSRGAVRLEWQASHEDLPLGASCLVPAALGAYALRPLDGSAEVLRITTPDRD